MRSEHLQQWRDIEPLNRVRLFRSTAWNLINLHNPLIAAAIFVSREAVSVSPAVGGEAAGRAAGRPALARLSGR